MTIDRDAAEAVEEADDDAAEAVEQIIDAMDERIPMGLHREGFNWDADE